MVCYKKLNLKKFSDGRGGLVPVEFGSSFSKANICIDVKRSFFIFPEIGEVRGRHAHKQAEQVFICLIGCFELVLDDGVNKEKMLMDNPLEAVHVLAKTWCELHRFSQNCCIAVFSNEHYDLDDYIFNYKDFCSNHCQGKL